MGADGVELDVRRTADDRLVVHHDPAVIDGRLICETVSTELPEPVPLLTDALDACDGMFVNVEIKNEELEPDFDPGDWVAHQVAAELARRGPSVRWLVSSFRLETVDLIRRLVPAVRTAWLVDGVTDAVINTTCERGHHGIHPSVALLAKSDVAAAHRCGLLISPWTCDEPDRIRELMAWGVDSICTNVPDTALEIRAGLASG